MFIARGSRQRTIHEFLLAVMVAPVIVAVTWFSSFDLTAIDQVKSGIGAPPVGVSGVSLVLFQMQKTSPLW